MIVELTDVAHGGYAVGRASDGRVVFARFGLPGEKVRVEVTNERSTMLNADVVEVLEPSPYRVSLRWEAAGPLGVGGADLQHVAWEHQAEWKSRVLQASIRRVGGHDLDAHLADQGMTPRVRALTDDAESEGWGRRTRIEFVVNEDGRPAMYREGSHDLVAVDEFPLASEAFDDLDLFGGWTSWWRPGTRVRAVAPSGSDPVVAIGESAWWAPGMRTDRYVREDVVVGSDLFSYRVRAAGFWQVHPRAAEELIAAVLRGAGDLEGRDVVELFSGAGMLTQPLGVRVGLRGSVRAFEGVAEATNDARTNLRDLPWVRSHTASINERSVYRMHADGRADTIVADPPRAGLGVKLARELASWDASRMVLVSCDPASMARDVAEFHRNGWSVESIDSIDLFGQTHHFETVTTLVH